MKKTTGALMVVLALFISFIWTEPLKAVVIPGLTGVEDGGAYNVDKLLNITLEGKYTLKFADTANNSQEINFWIDRTAPIVIGVENNGTYNSDRQITLSDGTNGSGIALVTLDNQDVTGTLVNNGFTITNEGTHNLVVTDKAGNITAVNNFKIEKQSKPVITKLLIGNQQWNEGMGEIWGYIFQIGAMGTLNGNSFTVGPENVVVTDIAGNPTPNYFKGEEEPERGPVDPNNGIYRVYIKNNGFVSENFLLVHWSSYGWLSVIQDTALPSVNISNPSKFSAVEGDNVTFTVTYSDDLGISGITLKPSDVKVYNNGVLIDRSVTISGTGNTRIITVPVGSEIGTLGIRILERTASDAAGKFTSEAVSTDFRVNSTPFVYESVKIYSNNTIPDPMAKKYSKIGDVVTLEFTTSEDVETPSVKVFGKTAAVTGSGKNWQAVYTIASGDTEGVVPFVINCNAGNNVYITQTESTDGSRVTFDKTKPTCSITDGTTFNIETVNIHFSDSASGIFSSTLSKNNGPADPVQNDTNLVEEGNYQLILTDFAGNIKTVGFTISRTKPTITSYTFRQTNHWYDASTHENLYSYVIDATGNTINASYGNVVVTNVSGQNINNYFLLAEDEEDQFLYHDPEGEFRIYIKDGSGNISDNYLTVRL